ncbi:putative bifunctional diguanylate cyclase/phosphodiesterase [Dechloromonas sp. A34]|uniref:putative bifunctional diguanylate cyclase/phosphodiesterase n=1 Tax=Dechloromonas sp. A34 TaxID=447588 RepID=UPI0022488CC8|nr:EAL domain-containing protein [Dechloromonas sp. A34]
MHDPALTWRKILVLGLVAIALAGGVSVLVSPLLGGVLLALLMVAGGGVLLRAQYRVSEQLRLQRRIIDHTSEAMMVTDLEQRILMVNPAFERITGYSAADVLGQTPVMLGAGRHGADFYLAIWERVAEKGSWEGEVWDRRKGGEIYPKQMRITAICETTPEHVSHYVAVFSDISAQKAQEARIDYLAHHDPLTSLPNRLALGLHLADALGNAARSETRLAVLIIDLDNFKTVNDSLGHHAGDQLLSEIARRLQLVLDWRGRLFRLGGDEFVVVLEDAGAEPVSELLERLLRTVGEPCQVLGHQLHTSPSIGISFFPTDGETAEALIRNADTAMYFAKASGRNNYQFFAEPMNAAANKRLHLESELWDALAKNQLLLHYQPQVDLVSGSVVGVEALVRWLHPQRGMIAPDDFIPIAEECGLILPLGHWVLLTACRQAKAWLDAGIDIGEMAVNISAHQFRQPEFAQLVRAVLLETGLPAERLELEITESTVMHSADASIQTLATLKEMGIKLAIDDFGTGYSSLAYLRLFPVDRLKIDRTFVADVASDSDAASLVTSIIALGRSLGLNLVAEGVETPAQADFLRALDCQRVQGFHFFRPVVAEEVAAVSDFFRLAEQAA